MQTRGAALLETVIVLPIVLFVVLGAVQVMLLQHARIATEYAAYCAARAGIVHHANWNVMQNAAMLATLPLYARTDTAANLLVAWGKVKATAEATQAVDMTLGTLERLAGDLLGIELPGLAQDISLVEVSVTSPDKAAFERAAQWAAAREQEALAETRDPRGPLAYPEAKREIDFDDAEMLQRDPALGRLAVQVRVLYPLRIPVISKLVFELWLATHVLRAREVRSDLPEWMQLRARVTEGGGAGEYLDEAVRSRDGEGPLDDVFTTSQWTRELRTLRWVAEEHGVYLLPLYASYTMQLQSSPFENNRREPVWFALEGP